jgi:hypothetical protein
MTRSRGLSSRVFLSNMTPARLKKRSFRHRLSQIHLPVVRPKHNALANCRACPPRISAKETIDLEMMVEDENTYVGVSYESTLAYFSLT